MNRPHYYDDTVTRAAAESMWPALREWLVKGGVSDADDLKDDHIDSFVSAAAVEEDAYAIARDLERDDWMVDSELVFLIDEKLWSARNSAHKNAMKEWVKTNNISCDFKVGDKVTFTHRGKDYPGEITRVNEDVAQVSIRSEAMGHILPNAGKSGTLSIVIDCENVKAV